MTSFTPSQKIKPSSRSAAQLARYQTMQRDNTLACDRRAWADLVRSYTICRLDELCFANRTQLYLGYRDWDTVRCELQDILLYSSSDLDKLPAGAVGFIYSCPVFLVDAEYHLMLCEVTE